MIKFCIICLKHIDGKRIRYGRGIAHPECVSKEIDRQQRLGLNVKKLQRGHNHQRRNNTGKRIIKSPRGLS